jgi:hypothetical protein
VALQTELNELTCRDRLRHCSLAEVAIAASSDALVLLGIEGTSDQTGRVRFAPLQDWSSLVGSTQTLWDGSSAAKSASNLKCGADDSSCEAPEPQPSNGASLALFAPTRQNGEGIGLWRAGAFAPAALVGLSFALQVRAGALQVDAYDGPSSRSLSGADPDRLGFDPAAIRVWQHDGQAGYFVAFDSLRGVELVYVDQLSDGAAHAFAAARARWLPEPGARHVALSLAADDDAEPRLGVAWRAPEDDGGWSIYLAQLSFALPDGFPDPGERLLVTSGRAIVDGPVLTYAAQGFEVAPEASTGGWFLLWVEAVDANQRLVAARVSGTSGALLGEPFVLNEGQVSHPFAFGSSVSTAGYGFVAASGPPQLNIGSLACRDE